MSPLKKRKPSYPLECYRMIRSFDGIFILFAANCMHHKAQNSAAYFVFLSFFIIIMSLCWQMAPLCNSYKTFVFWAVSHNKKRKKFVFKLLFSKYCQSGVYVFFSLIFFASFSARAFRSGWLRRNNSKTHVQDDIKIHYAHNIECVQTHK